MFAFEALPLSAKYLFALDNPPDCERLLWTAPYNITCLIYAFKLYLLQI